MIHWVDASMPGRLGIMPRPRGGAWLADEMRQLRQQGVQVLVSLLEPAEVIELGLMRESEMADLEGLAFVSHPIQDHGVPDDDEQFHCLVQRMDRDLHSGARVAIHCHAGIGRSSLLAACVLVARGATVDEAFQLLTAARGISVPEAQEQRAWVQSFASSHVHPGASPASNAGNDLLPPQLG